MSSTAKSVLLAAVVTIAVLIAVNRLQVLHGIKALIDGPPAA